MNKYVIKPIDQQFVVEGKDKSDAMLNFAWDWFSNDLNDYFQVLDENGLKEETFEELDVKLDRLSDTARKFILYRLLRDYEDDLKNESYDLGSPQTYTQYAVKKMVQDHARVVKEIADVLNYEIF